MNWLNTKYMIRAGVLTMLLLFPSLLSATCKPDTIIRNYKPDSLKLAIKADSIIAFHEGDSAFTIVKADTVLPYIAEPATTDVYIASAKTGNASFRPTLKYNMPEIWDYSPSAPDGITENEISGKLTCCSDLSRSIRPRRQK